MRKNQEEMTDVVKEDIDAKFKNEIRQVYPTGIPEDSILFYLHASMYYPYTGNTWGGVTFHDAQGQLLDIPIPAYYPSTPFTKKNKHLLTVQDSQGVVCGGGIPILIEKKYMKQIHQMKITWNIINKTYATTMTELCNLSFQPGKERIYEYQTEIMSILEGGIADQSLTEQINALTRYEEYCICSDQPLLRNKPHKIIHFPPTEEIIQSRMQYLKREKEISSLRDNLDLYSFYLSLQPDKGMCVTDRVLADRLIFPGIDTDLYLDGMKKRKYKLVISMCTLKLEPCKAPYKSYLLLYS